MAGNRAATPVQRLALPLVCMGAIVVLVYLMKLAFALPTTELDGGLEAADGAGTVFQLADGSHFPGEGKIRIGEEEISVQRIDAKGGKVQSGKDTVLNPNRFKVLERGVNGVAPANHAAGAAVSQVAKGLFFPENNSSFGDQVDELFYLILWITGIAFILTEGFFLYCIVAFWAKPGARSAYTHGNHRLEMVWTVIPAVILVALAVLQSGMWTEMKMSAPSATEPGVVTVQVVAKQFEWNFRQAGSDGRFGTQDDIPSTGRLVVPVDTPIRIELRAQDVLHSFFLPEFRVKQDAVPGLSVPVWFKAKRPGTFQIMCAELCGLGHSRMGGTLEVKTKEAYAEWVATESTKWNGENDGTDRPDWYGVQAKIWWWWDSTPTSVGFTGESNDRKRKS